MNTARTLQILFFASLLALALPPNLSAQTKKADIIDPAGFTRFLPQVIAGMPRTSHAVTAIEEDRYGSFTSSCRTYYGSGSVLLTIDHQPDSNSLKRVLIQNYMMMGNLANASVTRNISEFEGGVLITSVYHNANFIEYLARLKNDVLVRVVWKEPSGDGNRFELSRMIDLQRLGSMSPGDTGDELSNKSFSGE